MASAITTTNIDTAYPVAGQDNDSQGFRDNFTNLKTALDTAKTEITDLEAKAVLKSALSGDSLSNDGGGAVLEDFELKDMSMTRVAKGTTNGTVTCDYEDGSYVTVTTSGSITLAFSNFPASGKVGTIRVEINVANVAHTITLPSAVDIGQDQLIGSNGARVITPDRTGVHIFEFVTDDSGSSIAVIDCLRNNRAIEVRTATAVGQAGDKAGDIAADATNLYVCTATYDGSSLVWKKLVLQAI
tara:strand:+ start:2770 stop:3498 length:729 start_codon:yes stop_codon:yes gene_type:complete